MRRAPSKLWALILILAMTPGIVELSENMFHLVWQGHTAHEAADGDHHEPTDTEHGCTPGMHFCGCHSNLVCQASLGPTVNEPSRLYALNTVSVALTSTGVHLTVDRPPRA